MELLHKDLGSVASVDLEVVDGALVAAVKVPFIAVLEALAVKAKAAIPGVVDDALFDAVIAALKLEFTK